MPSNCGCYSVESSMNVFNRWGLGNSTPNYSNMYQNAYDPMSFSGSLFDFDNSTFANTYGGCGLGLGCLGSYMGGYGGFWGGADGHWDYIDQYADRAMEHNKNRAIKTRNNEREINTPNDGVQAMVAILQDKVSRDDQKNIMPTFNSLCAAVSKLYPTLDEAAVKTTALTLYAEITGVSLAQDIRNHGHGMFVQKFLNGLTFGQLYKGSAEENVEQLTGLPMKDEARAYGVLGKGVGTAVTTAGVTGGLTILGKNLGFVKKLMSHGKTGWIIGGIALAAGVISAIFSGGSSKES